MIDKFILILGFILGFLSSVLVIYSILVMVGVAPNGLVSSLIIGGLCIGVLSISVVLILSMARLSRRVDLAGELFDSIKVG
jgi:hypothetical protein